MVSGIAVITFLATAIILVRWSTLSRRPNREWRRGSRNLKDPPHLARLKRNSPRSTKKERAIFWPRWAACCRFRRGASHTGPNHDVAGRYRSAEATLAIQGMRILTPIG